MTGRRKEYDTETERRKAMWTQREEGKNLNPGRERKENQLYVWL